MNSEDDKELGAWLDAYQVAPADLNLQQRILGQITSPSRWQEFLELLGGWRVAGPAFALSVSLGICTPLLLEQSSNTSTSIGQDSAWVVAGLDASQDWTYE